MGWVILEGLDRSGKSTVSKVHETEMGFKVIHMSAPDKKYTKDGYVGPSYLDEILDLYMAYDGKDVIFDRSPYGELIWPHVYGRKPMLSDDDLEVLTEYEDRNSVQRILMIDPNEGEHWKRCVKNKEPLNLHQFKMASSLFNKLAHQYNFIPRQLGDFTDAHLTSEVQDPTPADAEKEQPAPSETRENPIDVTPCTPKDKANPISDKEVGEQIKLAKANAINTILSGRIVKRKGDIYDVLEQDIRSFLSRRLKEIFGDAGQTAALSSDEITILKLYCERIKEKQRRS